MFTIVSGPKPGKKKRKPKHQKCPYCSSYVIKLPRHLIAKHKNEKKVADAEQLVKGSNERRVALGLIAQEGNYEHNLEEFARGGSNLIVGRRLTEQEEKLHPNPLDAFLPCALCGRTLLKKNMWVHQTKKCPKRDSVTTTGKKKDVIVESKALLFHNMNFEELDLKYQNDILKDMKADDVSEVARSDPLIYKLGLYMYDEYGVNQKQYIRQDIRLASRLLIKLNENKEKEKELTFYLCPLKLDELVSAGKALAIEKRGKDLPQMDKASIGLKLGGIIQKCAKLKKNDFTKQGKYSEATNTDHFRELLAYGWKRRVSSIALRTIKISKGKKTETLPLTSDVMLVNKYISEQTKSLKYELIKSPDKSNWHKMAHLTLSRIVFFNRRRSGEASRMHLEDFNTCGSSSTEEQLKSLTKFERHLSKQMKLVRVVGKRFRVVSVLMTKEMVEAIELLNTTREAAGIPKENQFVFARSNSLEYTRGSEALQYVLKNVDGLKQPDRLTSTKLRKHVATVAQITNLTENEIDGLAKFLGHDIRVHREYYRLQDDIFITSKISKLLLAMDKGKFYEMKGKTLDEIEISGGNFIR